MRAILGEGPGAVRVSLSDNGVELRTTRLVVTGNADMAALIRPLAQGATPDEIPRVGDVTPTEIAVLLERLVEAGIPVDVWGQGWAALVKQRRSR